MNTQKSTNPRAVIRRINSALYRRDGNWAGVTRVVKLRSGRQSAWTPYDPAQDVRQSIEGNTVIGEEDEVKWLLEFQAGLAADEVRS